MALSAPTGLAASTELGNVTLTWNDVTGATHYDVKRKLTGEADASYVWITRVQPPTATEYGVPSADLSGAPAAYTWVYGVYAVNDSETSTVASVSAVMPLVGTANETAATIAPTTFVEDETTFNPQTLPTELTSTTASAGTGVRDSWGAAAIHREPRDYIQNPDA